MNYWDLYSELKTSLSKFEAMELLSHCSGKSKAQLLRDMREPCSSSVAERARALAARRASGEPLAYILGEWDFYGLRLMVTPDVLIPRIDSEAVVDAALQAIREFVCRGGVNPPVADKGNGRVNPAPTDATRILDLCCGSGCLGLALLSKLPNATLTAVDISDRALAVTQKNAAWLGFSERVTTVRADVLQSPPISILNSQFSILISNPPYVTAAEMPLLERGVAAYEPQLALYGGSDGLDFYRAIRNFYVADAFVLECAYAQREAVERLFEGSNATVVATGGMPR